MSAPDRPSARRPVRIARARAALAALAALVTLSPVCGGRGLPEPDDAAAAQYNAQLGANYLQRGELNQARAKLESALGQDDGNALAHATYAQLQQRIGDGDKARVHFERAIAIEPDEAEHRNAFGAFLCGAGDVEAAQREFAIGRLRPVLRDARVRARQRGPVHARHRRSRPGRDLPARGASAEPPLRGRLACTWPTTSCAPGG